MSRVKKKTKQKKLKRATNRIIDQQHLFLFFLFILLGLFSCVQDDDDDVRFIGPIFVFVKMYQQLERIALYGQRRIYYFDVGFFFSVQLFRNGTGVGAKSAVKKFFPFLFFYFFGCTS